MPLLSTSKRLMISSTCFLSAWEAVGSWHGEAEQGDSDIVSHIHMGETRVEETAIVCSTMGRGQSV